ncbi:MAG TPA: 2-hydroxyglutaryl-CoA dehydratase, partial [Myxococcota bacterium]|nr:2-hydroxyglutaryl-CoA dehydratase [Myxococcota bacterium]
MFEDHETKESSADTALEAELARFAEEEAQRLGLRRKHYKEKINTDFRKSQRAETTLWVSGLTMSQDLFVAASLSGIGYKVKPLDVPDQTALQLGKEFGNRGQCNPTYFTVGNLVKHLIHLRDTEGLTSKEIVERYVYVTAGACGPCRFGMYVTEYR